MSIDIPRANGYIGGLARHEFWATEGGALRPAEPHPAAPNFDEMNSFTEPKLPAADAAQRARA